MCAIAGFGDIRVQYRCGEKLTETNQIKPYINIVNDSLEPVILSNLKAYYVYTKEGDAPEEVHIDFAIIGSTSITAAVHEGCIEIGFTEDAGILNPGSETGDIHLRINKTDWSIYDQSDDRSFDASRDGYEDWRYIPLVENGTLIWGYDLLGFATPTPGPTPIPEGHRITVDCYGKDKTTLKYHGDYEGIAETPFTIGPYDEPFTVWFEPTELYVEGTSESEPDLYYAGYSYGIYSTNFPDETPLFKIALNTNIHLRTLYIHYRECGAPTPPPTPGPTSVGLTFIYVYDAVTEEEIPGVDIEMYVEDNPEPVILTTNSTGYTRVKIHNYDPAFNFLFTIDLPGYHPFEHRYISETSYETRFEFFLYPLSESTPEPTPDETPKPTLTPEPDWHNTWVTFTDWDPSIIFYHYDESYAVVNQTVYNTAFLTLDWGMPEISGTTITADARSVEYLGGSPRFQNDYTHEYHLGRLVENQTYTFIFKANGEVVREMAFTVRPSPAASPHPGGITGYRPTTDISIITSGDVTCADVEYLFFETDEIYHIIIPYYPAQGAVVQTGNEFSAEPDLLRYEEGTDLTLTQGARHYSVRYTLGTLLPGNYSFESFGTAKDFIIASGPTPSPTPVPDTLFLISGYTDITEGITLHLSGAKSAATKPGKDGYYLFDNLEAGGEYTVSLSFEPGPPTAAIEVPEDLSSVTGNVNIEAAVTSDVCSYVFEPPERSYSPLLSNQVDQNFVSVAASDCCMLITGVDYLVTGASGSLYTCTDTTESMCSNTYNHQLDVSDLPDWSCTITVVVTDEAGKKASDMVSIFNDDSPTPSPTPGTIDDPGAVWIMPEESVVRKGSAFTTEIHVNTGSKLIGAYGLIVEYDEAIVGVDTSIGLNGVEETADGFVAAVNADEPGALIFSGFDPYGKGPEADLNFLIIHWTALNEGSTELVITIRSLVDVDTEPLGDPHPLHGIVTVVPRFTPGDANGDDVVNIIDALLTTQFYVGLATDNFVEEAADVDCNGNIDIVDALLIARYYVGLIVTLEC
jgi:hypothetical protein